MTAAPPPLPRRSAAEAAADAAPPAESAPSADSAPSAASAPPADTAAYDPAADPDDTGVPVSPGRNLFAALFDISFRTFITRRLAGAFYVVGLVAIAMAFLVYFIGHLVTAILLLATNVPGGISLLVATIVIAPIVAFLAVVLLRFVIEAVVALIAIAENTERTAAQTRR